MTNPNPTIKAIEKEYIKELMGRLTASKMISRNKKVCGGLPTIRGTRITIGELGVFTGEFYRTQITKLLEGLRNSGYRPNDNRWEKGKHGYRVKWYGQGYNHAVNEQNEKINKLIK